MKHEEEVTKEVESPSGQEGDAPSGQCPSADSETRLTGLETSVKLDPEEPSLPGDNQR